MTLNYIKTALRNFNRNKSITVIKILGLALGLAVTFFILIYVSTETSYNDYNKKRERIFRINQVDSKYGWKSANTPFPMRDGLISNFPEIEESVRIIYINNIEVNKGTQIFKDNRILCTDSSFFEVFTVQKIVGNFSDFKNNNSVVLTKTAAIKYFGTIDIINEPLECKSGEEKFILNVIAVIEDLPQTSTLKADFISTINIGLDQANKRMIWSDGKERASEFYRTNWKTNFLETFVLFQNENNALDFDKKLKLLEEKYLEDTTERDYYIQNLEDIYLHSKDISGNENLGDLNSIYIFSVIAFLVLLIACINYIILSISQIITRTKEIGIRKISGANQFDLFNQISIESFLIILFTVPLSFILIEQFRPMLETVLGKQVILSYNLKFILGFVGILIFVVFVPGMNIMYYLNKISPVSILRKENQNSKQKLSLRKALIILQFIIFISLVVLSLGIKKQIEFSTQNNLGFNPENKLVIQVASLVKEDKFQTLKTELLKVPEIKNVSGAMWLPPSNSRMTFNYSDSIYTEPINMEALFVDQDFIETFDIKLVEGKSLSEFETNPDWKILVNESAAKMLGRDKIIGRTIWNGEVIGIVNDFRFHSVHEVIHPMILIAGEHMIREMVVSFNYQINDKDGLGLKSVLEDFYTYIEKEPELLSERFKNLYEKENRLGSLIGIFSFLAIFIASIGLLGITIFNTKKQTKNIAIRKVNGASPIIIWKLLISNYVKLIIIALFIAIPISYLILNTWLQGFAYRISIEWWLFAVAGILALFISIATISWYSFKAARQNPVNGLRYE